MERQSGAFDTSRPLGRPTIDFEATAWAGYGSSEEDPWAPVQSLWEDKTRQQYGQKPAAQFIQQPVTELKEQYQPPTTAQLHWEQGTDYRPGSSLLRFEPETTGTERSYASIVGMSTVESRTMGRGIIQCPTKRVVVLPSGSPVPHSAVPTVRSLSEKRDKEQVYGGNHPKNKDDCAFCLRSDCDFDDAGDDAGIHRDNSGKWVEMTLSDLRGVQRRLSQFNRAETKPNDSKSEGERREREEEEDFWKTKKVLATQLYGDRPDVEGSSRVGEKKGGLFTCVGSRPRDISRVIAPASKPT